MDKTMFNWLLNLVYEFAKFGNWLTTDLKYINMSPLALISFTGLTLIITFLALRLFIGN